MSNLHHQEKVTQKTFSLKWLLKTVDCHPMGSIIFFEKVGNRHERNCKISHITVAGCFQKFEFMDVLQLAETTCERFQEVDDFIDVD